jgi:shikimate kinase
MVVPEQYYLTRPVFLIGFMGAGKSSVARRLARMYGLSSIDTDAYIVRREQSEIKDIFATKGEDAFRQIEHEVLQDIASLSDSMVVSCGGGIILRDDNREILREGGFTVHLVVDVDEASRRIADKTSRPLFNNLEEARGRLAARMPFYKDAATVDIYTAGKNVGIITREVALILKKEGILCLRQE